MAKNKNKNNSKQHHYERLPTIYYEPPRHLNSAIINDHQRSPAIEALQYPQIGEAGMARIARVARMAWDLEDLRGTG